MNIDFAAAMRRALEHVRAHDVAAATNVIQAALAGRTPQAGDGEAHPDITPPPAQQRARPRLIDPHAETVELERAHPDAVRSPAAMRLRLPLGEVVKTLRKLRESGLPAILPGKERMPVKTPRAQPTIPEGAQFLDRSFTCAAGTRAYKLYIPADLPSRPRGLVVMLHGCTQDPDDFAVGTNMNALAETHGLLIAYPEQGRAQNVSSCWNWFRPGDQRRGDGEPAIIAGMTRTIADRFGLERERIFVAGLSAGGAMAAVMAETYPDLYAAVGVHSGLPYASANDVMTALAAMRGQLDMPPAPTERPAADLTPRMIIFHGGADQTVHPSNADRIFAAARAAHLSSAQRSERGTTPDGRSYTRCVVETRAGGRAAEYWLIDGAGHAWSGGRSAGSFTDPDGPDASAEMARFFLDPV